ncbi:methyltransferase [Comamonas sp. JC664]|uniref:methyltransferase n=1 Tax=Comamonas sp. JC664 TaxID=2801917 RepID=UPI00174B67AD|nr:methyltransferase [Comamonas sp. JC664]
MRESPDIESHSPPPVLERAIFGFMASHVLFAADDLGVLDLLAQGEAFESTALATKLSVSEEALDRLLTALVGMELLTRDGGGYRMPPQIRPFLSRSHGLYCGGLFPLLKHFSMRTFMHLGDALVDGAPQWKKVLPGEGAAPFDLIYQDAGALERFAQAMWSLGYQAATELVRPLALERGGHLVDLGGGSGSFAVAALQQWPALTADVFDRPAMESTVARQRDAHGLGSRLGFVGGDFFQSGLPRADLYALGFILSDWTDAQSLPLLRAIHSALAPGGQILILERLFNEQRTGPLPTALMDLCMLLETGGKHRSAAQYHALLRQAGFSPGPVHHSSYEKHMVVGIKA